MFSGSISACAGFAWVFAGAARGLGVALPHADERFEKVRWWSVSKIRESFRTVVKLFTFGGTTWAAFGMARAFEVSWVGAWMYVGLLISRERNSSLLCFDIFGATSDDGCSVLCWNLCGEGHIPLEEGSIVEEICVDLCDIMAGTAVFCG